MSTSPLERCVAPEQKKSAVGSVGILATACVTGLKRTATVPGFWFVGFRYSQNKTWLFGSNAAWMGTIPKLMGAPHWPTTEGSFAGDFLTCAFGLARTRSFRLAENTIPTRNIAERATVARFHFMMILLRTYCRRALMPDAHHLTEVHTCGEGSRFL